MKAIFFSGVTQLLGADKTFNLRDALKSLTCDCNSGKPFSIRNCLDWVLHLIELKLYRFIKAPKSHSRTTYFVLHVKPE